MTLVLTEAEILKLRLGLRHWLIRQLILHCRWTGLRPVGIQLVLILLGFLYNAVIAGGLKAWLGLDEVSRSLIVEAAGGEGAGAEGGKVRKVHDDAPRLGGLKTGRCTSL